MSDSTLIAIPVFDGFTALDAVGPYEVLSRCPGAEVVFCAERAGEVRTDRGSLGLRADAALAELDQPDVIVVPGGIGSRRHLDPDDPYVQWARRVSPGAGWTTSVCTGSLILAAAGLLAGREATTHWAARDTLTELGAIAVAERVVWHERERIVTAAGVSSGIDMALRLASRLAGEREAAGIELAIEYDPDPPFGTGSPDRAPAEVIAAATSREDAADAVVLARLAAADEPS